MILHCKYNISRHALHAHRAGKRKFIDIVKFVKQTRTYHFVSEEAVFSFLFLHIRTVDASTALYSAH